MKRVIKGSYEKGHQDGVWWTPGADGRVYVTNLGAGALGKALELGFNPVDPITGLPVDVDVNELDELWRNGEVDLSR